MGTATTLSTPQDQVEALMREVAAENALDIEDQLKELNPTTSSIRSEASVSTADKEDQLSRRCVAFYFKITTLLSQILNGNVHYDSWYNIYG